MAQENVGKFQELLRSDEALQAKFRAAVEALATEEKGEIANFEAVVAPLAQELGLPFTYEEAKQFALDGAELDEEQLEAVAGGWSFCVIQGWGTIDAEFKCNDSGGYGWGACAVAGSGLFAWNS